MNSLKNYIPENIKKPVREFRDSYLSYKKFNLIYRKFTWRIRCLPDFIIIGAQKSGTTSLFYYLSQHPQLIPSIKKEVHFFDGGLDPGVDNFSKGQSWYRAHFPKRNELDNHEKVFEASPSYLFNPYVPERIFNLLPNTKLIILLRNPTERAISHYFHQKRKGVETLPIFDAFKVEEERLAPIIENEDYRSKIFLQYSYKSRGLYYEQIIRYLKYFKFSNLLILHSDDLFMHTEITLQQTFNFIDVDPEFKILDLQPKHVSNNRTKVETDVYDYLNEYFYSQNQKLFSLLDVKYDW